MLLNLYDRHKLDHENSFDFDSISNELDGEPENTVITNFDNDFPLNTSISKQTERFSEIFRIIKKCYDNKNAFLKIYSLKEFQEVIDCIGNKINEEYHCDNCNPLKCLYVHGYLIYIYKIHSIQY